MTGQYDTSNIGSTDCDPQCIGATLFRLAIWRVKQDGAIASDFGFGKGGSYDCGIRASSAAEFLHWHWPGECFRRDHSCVAMMSMSSTPLRE